MESIPLSDRVSNLENYSTDKLYELQVRLNRQCLGVKVLVAAVVVLAVVAVALSVAVARLAVPTAQGPAPSLSDPRPANVSWVSVDREVTVMVGVPVEKPKSGGFELEFAPGDPRLPSYQYPGCACPLGPQGIQGPIGSPSVTLTFGAGLLGNWILNTTNSLSNAFFTGSNGVFTLAQDGHFHNLTLGPNVRLIVCGWRLFVYETLTMMNNSVISCNGNNGPNGAAAAGTTAAATTAGTLGAGQAGAASTTGLANGAAGTAATNSVGGSGGAGGTCNARTGGAGGAASITAASSGGVYVYTTRTDGRNLAGTLMPAGAGGGSGGDNALTNSASGGGGGGAGVVYVFARNFVIGTNASVVYITAIAGNGGNGFSTTAAPGGGGGGGLVFLVTNSLVATFSSNLTMSASGGAAGTGGCVTTPASAGSNGQVTLITSDDPDCATSPPSSFTSNSQFVTVVGGSPQEGSISCADAFLNQINTDDSSSNPDLTCELLGIGC